MNEMSPPLFQDRRDDPLRHPPPLPGPQPGGGRAKGPRPPQAAEDAHGADGGAVQVRTQNFEQNSKCLNFFFCQLCGK